MELGIYLPQVAFTWEEVLHRAVACEAAGVDHLWLYDHLWAPEQPDLPSLEGWTLATALLARTERLRVGHMVLCNGFRHPALLGRMIATLDAVSGGRLEVGLGSGSYEPEHARAGLPWGSLGERTERLADTLEIVTSMLRRPSTTVAGRHTSVTDLPSAPVPPTPPRLTVGGAGERFTLPLVARFADVWNVPTYALAELDAKVDALHRACEAVGRDPGSITLSLEAVVALAPDEASVDKVRAVAERRFGSPGFGLAATDLVGTPERVVERLKALQDKGFEHLVLFTHDRCSEQTLDLIGREVVPHLG